MIDPTFGGGREPLGGSRSQTLRSTLSFQVSPILTADHQLLPLAFSFHYLRGEPVLISTKVAMPTMVAPNLPTAPSLPCLKTDLCPDRSLEAETAGLKMVKKGFKVGHVVLFLGRRPNVFFSYRTIWDAHRIDQTSPDWFLPSTTFVHNKCLP